MGACASTPTAPAPSSSLSIVPAGSTPSPSRPCLADLRRLLDEAQAALALDGVGGTAGRGVGGSGGGGVSTGSHPLLRSGSSVMRLVDKQSVLVAVRVRPLNTIELAAASTECLSCEGGGTVRIKAEHAGAHKTARDFNFDVVLREESTQAEVYVEEKRGDEVLFLCVLCTVYCVLCTVYYSVYYSVYCVLVCGVVHAVVCVRCTVYWRCVWCMR